MSADSPLTFRVAQQPGDPNKPSEDRVFLTPNASIVLDGASQWIPLERTGGWIAEQLGRRLQAGLLEQPARDLVELLDAAVDDLITTFQLEPGKSPSTTVNIVRAIDDHLEVLVLCDSPVVTLATSGQLHEIRDERLAEATSRLERPSNPPRVHARAWRDYINAFEEQRNQPDGFWCVSASRQVGQHAVTAQFQLSAIEKVMAVTDGISVGVDRFGHPGSWNECFLLADQDPSLVATVVTDAENADHSRTRWPRTKIHDDKTIVVATRLETK